jgi:phosphoribosylformylglycinamidine cyclo-ligase
LPELGRLLDSGKIKGLAHITGGGFFENIPRILPEGVSVEINRGTWPELPVFGVMQKLGNVADLEMFRTFNMGIGMIVVCAEIEAESLLADMKSCFRIGRVVEGSGEVLVS